MFCTTLWRHIKRIFHYFNRIKSVTLWLKCIAFYGFPSVCEQKWRIFHQCLISLLRRSISNLTLNGEHSVHSSIFRKRNFSDFILYQIARIWSTTACGWLHDNITKNAHSFISLYLFKYFNIFYYLWITSLVTYFVAYLPTDIQKEGLFSYGLIFIIMLYIFLVYKLLINIDKRKLKLSHKAS